MTSFGLVLSILPAVHIPVTNACGQLEHTSACGLSLNGCPRGNAATGITWRTALMRLALQSVTGYVCLGAQGACFGKLWLCGAVCCGQLCDAALGCQWNTSCRVKHPAFCALLCGTARVHLRFFCLLLVSTSQHASSLTDGAQYVFHACLLPILLRYKKSVIVWTHDCWLLRCKSRLVFFLLLPYFLNSKHPLFS